MTWRKIRRIVLYVFLILIALNFIYPFFFMFLSSLKNNPEILQNPYGFPSIWRWSNYRRAWTKAGLGRSMLNSGVVAVTTVVLTIFVCSLTSYILARHKFKLNFAIFSFFLLGLMIPAQGTIIPTFLILRRLKLVNTYLALILPYTAVSIPFAILFLTGYMKSIPISLDETAVMEGCGQFRIYTQIIFPLSKPALVTVAVLTMLDSWNEFLYALVLATKPIVRTLPIALSLLVGEHIQEHGVQTAAAIISLSVMLVAYLIFQKQMVEGLTTGALKG